MNQQQVRKIKEYVRKLSGLCDGEAIPSHKYPDAINQLNSTNLAAERMMYQAAEIGDKAQRAYRERVLALLGDNTDYWVFIARIFEDTKPRWFSRLEAIRKTILLHTDPNKKYENWLVGTHQGKLSPDTKLRSEIERLADELRREADLTSTKQTETKQKTERSMLMLTDKSSQENWDTIKSEYDISKKDFGKKINFVKDKFKRKVIFRDVEDAFVLASQGFSKPAIILAGGIIEELLRLYLEHKKIKMTSNRFVDYIKACEDKGLLKRGVLRLTDSVRDFRNLVHLANEKAKRHTISKATAKGAVSSIFTIANDFQ